MATKPFHFHPRDLHGLARLATHATSEATAVVEAMHAGIAWPAVFGGDTGTGRAGGISGLIYAGVRGVTGLLSSGLDFASPLLLKGVVEPASTPERDTWLSVLCGVIGDHLAETDNPLAIATEFRTNGQTLPLESEAMAAVLGQHTSKIVVLAHGLCGHERQWKGRSADYPEMLESEFGFTPVFLRYNSGRHVSENGRDLAALLEELVANWPVPVEELVLVGHSMGGLVARSAMHFGSESEHDWVSLLTKIAFLGTPHHGAPLERGGLWIQQVLGSLPFAAPLAALPRLRSAGITDLRHGNVLDEDWQGQDRFESAKDSRRVLALPESVKAIAVAATTRRQVGRVRHRLVGDGLVPIPSALGLHDDPTRQLLRDPKAMSVVPGIHHMELLGNKAVLELLKSWMAA